jgi:hypothetical protein
MNKKIKTQPTQRKNNTTAAKSSSKSSSKYQELAMKQNKRPEGFDPKAMRLGSSKRPWGNYALAVFIGIVSGQYLFAEPLREYHVMKAEEDAEAAAAVAVVSVPAGSSAAQ